MGGEGNEEEEDEGEGGRGFKGTDPSINISPTHAFAVCSPDFGKYFLLFLYFLRASFRFSGAWDLEADGLTSILIFTVPILRHATKI